LSLHQASFPGPLPDPSCMLLRCTHYMWRQWHENQPVHVRCPGRQMGGPAPAHHGLDDYVLVECSMVVKKPSTHSPPLAGLLGAWRAHRGRVSSVHRDHSHTHTHSHTHRHTHTHTHLTKQGTQINSLWQPLAGCRQHEVRQPQGWLPPDSTALTQHACMHKQTVHIETFIGWDWGHVTRRTTQMLRMSNLNESTSQSHAAACSSLHH